MQARTSEAKQVERQKETEEHLSKIQQELQQVKATENVVADESIMSMFNMSSWSTEGHSEELQNAKDQSLKLQHKISETKNRK